MRIIRFLIFYVLVSIMGLLGLIFLGLNHFTIQLDLLNTKYSVSVAWVMVGAAGFGFVVALLVLLPGRLAVGLHARSLERELRYLERKLDDSEDLLEDREELRARLLAQHEALMERHERMLLRHQSLMTDHSHTLAERDDARAQLNALRISRPASIAAHISGAATALRLLPPAKQAPADPVSIARPTTPPPAAHPAPPTPAAQVAAPAPTPAPDPIAAPASATETRVEPVAPPTAPPVEPVEPMKPMKPVEPVKPTPTRAPWRLVAPKPATVEAGPAPATVPVVSVSAEVISPAGSESAASVPPPATKKAEKALKAPSTMPPAWRRLLADLRMRGAHAWQSTRALFGRMRQGIATGWNSIAAWVRTGWNNLATWITIQATAQRVRIHQLWQRLMDLRTTRGDA